jgi:hypothetical protein
MLRCNHYFNPSPQGASKRNTLDLFSEFSLQLPAAERAAATAVARVKVSARFTDRITDQARQVRARTCSARNHYRLDMGWLKSRHELQLAVALTRSQHSPTRKDCRTGLRQLKNLKRKIAG